VNDWKKAMGALAVGRVNIERNCPHINVEARTRLPALTAITVIGYRGTAIACATDERALHARCVDPCNEAYVVPDAGRQRLKTVTKTATWPLKGIRYQTDDVRDELIAR